VTPHDWHDTRAPATAPKQRVGMRIDIEADDGMVRVTVYADTRVVLAVTVYADTRVVLAVTDVVADVVRAEVAACLAVRP